jgi:hypothetical protein
MRKIVDLVGCEQEGKPIAFNLNLDYDSSCFDQLSVILDDVWWSLIGRGYSLTSLIVVGTYSEGVIQNLDGSSETEFHEEVHRWMDGPLAGLDLSFSEAVAYGLTMFNFDLERVPLIEDAFAGLCDYHAWSVDALANGGLGVRGNEMQTYIGFSNFVTDKANWATFLEVVKNLRYVPLVLNVLRRYGEEEGRDILFRSAQVMTGSSLEEGLEYLTSFTDRSINGYSAYQLNGRGGIQVNTVPYSEQGLFLADGLALKVQDANQDFLLELRSFDRSIRNQLFSSLSRNSRALEEAIGSELLVFVY